MQRKDHWERIYSTKEPRSVSWFQERADLSLRLIRSAQVPKNSAIIDVGAGASTLVDDLLAEGFTDVTVLDLSAAALAAAGHRLGTRAARVHWVEADVTAVDLPANTYDVWHDRAVFHFLIGAQERAAYVRNVSRALKPGGHVIVATFAEDGPTQCSGLPVMRYRAEELHAEFGDPFVLMHREKESHRTPWGAVQQFVYCYCRKNDA